MTKSLVLHLIGCESGASFSGPITERSEEKAKQSRIAIDSHLKIALLSFFRI